MKRMHRNGFVLILVVTAIALVGVVLFVLADGSGTMLFQTDRAYLRAVRRNLTASGLAWAQRNLSGETGSSVPAQTIQLDVSRMGTGGLTLSLDPEGQGRPGIITISASCTKGRQTIRTNGRHVLEGSDSTP